MKNIDNELQLSKVKLYSKEAGEEKYTYVVSKETLKSIGTEIKIRREEAKKPLDAYANKCSVSYLSKIENNKIVPTYEVLNDYCAGVGITRNELDIILSADDKLLKYTEYLFNENYTELEKEYHKVRRYTNFKAKLITLFYLYFNKHNSLYQEILHDLLMIKENLNSFDKNLLILFEMHNAILNNEALTAYKLYESAKDIEDNYLKLLLKREWYYAVAKSGIIDPILAYHELEKLYFDNHVCSLEKEYQVLIEALLRTNFTLSTEQLKYLNLSDKIYYAITRSDKKLLNNLIKNLNEDYRSYDVFLLKAAINKNKEAFDIFNKELDLNNLNAREIINANITLLTINNDKEGLGRYLVKEAFTYAYQNQDYYAFRKYIKLFLNTSKNNLKLKEVERVIELFTNLVEAKEECMH